MNNLLQNLSKIFKYLTINMLRVRKEGEFYAIFESQTENFVSQKVQSTTSSETEFCWLSTQ